MCAKNMNEICVFIYKFMWTFLFKLIKWCAKNDSKSGNLLGIEKDQQN